LLKFERFVFLYHTRWYYLKRRTHKMYINEGHQRRKKKKNVQSDGRDSSSIIRFDCVGHVPGLEGGVYVLDCRLPRRPADLELIVPPPANSNAVTRKKLSCGRSNLIFKSALSNRRSVLSVAFSETRFNSRVLIKMLMSGQFNVRTHCILVRMMLPQNLFKRRIAWILYRYRDFQVGIVCSISDIRACVSTLVKLS